MVTHKTCGPAVRSRLSTPTLCAQATMSPEGAGSRSSRRDPGNRSSADRLPPSSSANVAASPPGRYAPESGTASVVTVSYRESLMNVAIPGAQELVSPNRRPRKFSEP